MVGAGGTSPYTYTITGTGSNVSGVTSGNFTELIAGTYNYSITDANNCSAAAGSLIVGQPDPMIVTGPTADVCPGSSIVFDVISTINDAYDFDWTAKDATNASLGSDSFVNLGLGAVNTTLSLSCGTPINNPITFTFTPSTTGGCVGTSITRTVYVRDLVAPNFTRPANITISTNASCTYDASVTATGDVTDEADNCSTSLQATYTDNTVQGATTGSYLITRTWSLVDACGNAAATQNQIIVVNDNTPPTTPTLADVTGECSATAIIATTTDACSGTITGTTTDPLTYSTQGTHVIHWTFTDESGNTITANQNVIIKDINNPVTPTLADITAQCSATVTAPTTTDNCVGTVTGTTTTIFPITTQGTTVVAWTFDDGNGNSIIVNQNVIITDNIAPVAPVSLADVTEECSATPTAPTATDNCAGTVTGITTTEFPITAQGTTVVTWTFDDGHGNSSTVTQNVILHDVTQPVLVDVPANISVNNETDLCTKVVTFTPPSATDNCTIPTLTQTAGLPSGSAFPIGTTTNTFSVTDNGGNITTASFDVVVTDSQFPTITAPANIIVCEGTSVSTLGTPTTTDNCPLPIDAVTNNNTVTVPGVFPIGVTTIVWTVTDATGHITTANQTVTVNALPTVSITSNNSPICTGASATFTLSGTANAVVTYSLDGGTTTASVTLDNSGAGTVTITEATANQTLTLVSALIGTTNCSKTFTETSTITVNQLPTLTVVNPAAVCSPATVDITANTVQTANTGTTTNYYSTNASAMAGGTGDILTPTAIATGSTVYIRSESVAGCYIIQPVTVVVNPLPTLTVVNPTALCSPATVDITTATVQIANTGTTTNYYSTNALAITGGRGDISTPTAIASSTTIYIRSELATSCYVIQPVTVTVNQLPTLTVVNPAAVCSPATVDITANTVQTANTGTTTNYYSTNASAMAGGTGDILTPTAIATGSTVYIRSESVAGCYIIQPVTVVVNPLPTLTTTSTNSSCNGASNGTITVTTSATSPIFSKDGGTTYVSGPNPYSFSTLAGGTYSIRVKDANTCESVVSSVTLTQPDVIDVTAIPTAALCFGGNGSAALSATGGSGIYTFTSTGGTVTGNSLSAPAGTYTITATDGNNCTGTFSVTIGQSAAALSATTSKVNVLCKGGATGTATVLATGGTIGTGYTYSWNTSPVQTTATATGLVAGTYTVTITDANGCTFSPAVVVISEPTTATSITASGSSHICEASALTLTSTPVSSTGGLTYAWSGPNAFAATTQNASIAVTTLAAAGIYMITVKDANSCIATATTSVVINPLPTIYTVSGTGVICSGIASPITLSGSTVGINYKLAAIGFFGSVLAGTGSALVFTPPSNILATYTIEAINAATGCKVLMAGSVSTINATNPTITITAQTNVSCFGGNNGSVTAVASAGSGTYTYTFNGGISQPTGVFSGKTAGTYPIVATDTNTGCIGSINAVITQPATLPSVTVASSGIACVGNTVTLTATATGGTGTTYMYNWNGTGFVSTPTLAVTSTSTNTLVVKDVNGCTSSTVLSTTVTFNTPTPPTIAGSTTLCSGSTLSLSTSAVGTYAWSGPNAFTSASASISIANVQAVNADTYTVTVTDANSCIASATANVVINITPTISITPTTAILSCTTPSTIITAIGATIYSWTGTGGFTATTAAATITAGGTYVVTGVANGCSATASVIVTENKVTPTITITPTTAILTCLNPTALVTASGASTYSWTGAGGFTATTAIATITAQGTYVVTGTGSNGCTATSSVIVTEDKTPPTVTVSSTTFILTCLTPSAAVTASGADSYSWTGTRGFTATTAMAIITTAGTYTVIGTNANGCTASVRIAIGQSKTPPTISVTPTTAILTCLTPSTTITASGALTYTWSGTGGFTASTATALITIGGTYTVIGTNGNGCTASASVVITENKVAPTATVTGAGVLCSGSTISLTATGGGTYQWSGSNSFTSTSAAVNIPNATVTNSGTYIVTVTNANGCTASAMATITVNPAIAVPTTQAFASISSGESISLTATGCSGTLLWFKSSDDSPATMPVSPTTMTSYYAKCEVTTNGVTCTSDKSGDVVVTVGIIISIKTGGAWEDPTTWDAGRVPLSTDEVIIDTNHNVIITTLNAVAKKLRYRTNAKVTFANPATKLTILGL